MTQINLRLNEEIYKIISYLAEKKSVSKSEIAREFLMKGLSQDLLPLLLKDYQEGKISLKKIVLLTKLSPIEILRKMPMMIEEPPISPEVDDYTKRVADKILEQWEIKKSDG
ncbi:MAG: hypothetical protein ACTSYB_12595 [Candidatus Helarchaeota archaeon]